MADNLALSTPLDTVNVIFMIVLSVLLTDQNASPDTQALKASIIVQIYEFKNKEQKNYRKVFPIKNIYVISQSDKKRILYIHLFKNMDITGKIILALPLQEGVSQRTGNPWKSQDYVIEYQDGMFTRKCCFRVFGEERLRTLAIKQGETCTVSLDIDAREYNGKWYNDLRAYKVLHDVQTPVAESASPSAPANPEPPRAAQPNDDLPF